MAGLSAGDWVQAGALLLLAVALLGEAAVRSRYARLRRVALACFGAGTAFVLAAVVLDGGAFVPWGIPAVVCLVAGSAAGLWWWVNRRDAPDTLDVR